MQQEQQQLVQMQQRQQQLVQLQKQQRQQQQEQQLELMQQLEQLLQQQVLVQQEQLLLFCRMQLKRLLTRKLIKVIFSFVNFQYLKINKRQIEICDE
jgi:hypothetical protein